MLSFDINVPSIYFFLNRFVKVAGLTNKEKCFANYLAELTLIDAQMNKWSPSKIAAASIYVSRKMLQPHTEKKWPEFMVAQTGFTEPQTRGCARDLYILLNYAHRKKNFRQVFKKFEHKIHEKVSGIPVALRREAYQAQQRNEESPNKQMSCSNGFSGGHKKNLSIGEQTVNMS